MQKIISNDDILSFLQGKNTLRDSELMSFEMKNINGELAIETFLNLRPDAEFKEIKLKFYEVLECAFYYSANFTFYNVEAFKFIKLENGFFYLSLDPDEKIIGASKFDQDFIKAKHIELFASAV